MLLKNPNLDCLFFGHLAAIELNFSELPKKINYFVLNDKKKLKMFCLFLSKNPENCPLAIAKMI